MFDASCSVRPVEGFQVMAMVGYGRKVRASCRGVAVGLGCGRPNQLVGLSPRLPGFVLSLVREPIQALCSDPNDSADY